MPNEKKLFLLDAMALIYRSYFALVRSPRITSKGKNTNAQFGFTTTLLDLINKEKPTHLAVVFEGGKSDQDTNRNAQYAAYKANRQEQPEDISNALPDIQRIIKAFNLPCMGSAGYEADDVIGTLALEAADLGYTVYMVTPDKDFGQLVRDHQIMIYKPGYQGNSFEILDEKKVCEKWQIKRVDQVIDILGLMGDAVDNIPGIAGVGEKTAAKLLAEYDTVEGVLENANNIKGALGEKVRNGAPMAILSKKLATIMTDAPVSFHEEDFRVKDWDKEKLKEVFTELEFKALGKRILGEEYEENPVASKDLFGNTVNKTTGFKAIQLKPAVEEAPTLFEEAPVYDTIETVPHNYQLVQGEAEVDELITNLLEQTEISFDTETTHKDANEAELVGLSFCWVQGEGYYVPVSADKEEAKNLLEKFRPVFERDEVTWIGQNIKYDLLILKWNGIELKGKFWDTMLAHYLFEPDGKRNMDALSMRYLKYQPVSIESLIGKAGKNQGTMRDVPVEKVKDYAAEDADVTLQLKKIFAPLVVNANAEKLLHEMEGKLVPVLAEMEYEGVGVDVPFLQRYSLELNDGIKAAEESVYAKAGVRFNLGSPKQLGEILFNILKIDSGRKTRTGQQSTGEDVLVKLRNKHDIVEDILTYRQLSKLKSTYVDSLPLLINKKTGRVHTCFNQTVAVTGRLSSNNPNLQNIPIKTEKGREIRKAFTCRGEGWAMISADYSQIELRIIAGLSGDPGMVAAFLENKDIHTATAARVFGVPENEVTPDMRRKAKGVNFGLIYGQTAFGLSETLGTSRGEAKEIIDTYFTQYAGIKKYIDSQINFAREHQYVQSINGRKRWLRDINSSNQTVRGFAERNSVNMPIQGTAADMIKLAMIAVDRELKKENLKTRMVLQVHDELIFDVPLDELQQAKEIIKREMEGAMKLPNNVPVQAEAGHGGNWLEAH